MAVRAGLYQLWASGTSRSSRWPRLMGHSAHRPFDQCAGRAGLFDRWYWSNRVKPPCLTGAHWSNRNARPAHWSNTPVRPVGRVTSRARPPARPAGTARARPPSRPAGTARPELVGHRSDCHVRAVHAGSVT
ncbi:hypothetical protein PCASD_11447 [Puccinia coronata f. sp. avenae]|uniref:Uncharacterized protein n=1 Tax=Puccinia coronata f. sp. avenae TaxID=200324 RepID=A0A2N5V0P8_9BASI|nr:hypothetical protein PCASD_11447 [Puccinia coronata f. sp. avenae]